MAHAGKDTAGAHLIDNHGYTRYGCADPVKEHAYLLDVRVNGSISLSMLLEILDYDWDRAAPSWDAGMRKRSKPATP
ncbi:hypothetical protein [Pseudarthrobacter sulfonivorans]|uniref:hypothetical protein n=1 Tax=Pseudarthrobacter sulfonivorans TaxID=121292 RepID=UPI0028633530|nr:hypothetical protein [Pseudarthrobacter sulfonivorans]MDR6417689.1 hypothetical protein [Pseudarthrobacter sulfonivorans]